MKKTYFRCAHNTQGSLTPYCVGLCGICETGEWAGAPEYSEDSGINNHSHKDPQLHDLMRSLERLAEYEGIDITKERGWWE